MQIITQKKPRIIHDRFDEHVSSRHEFLDKYISALDTSCAWHRDEHGDLILGNLKNMTVLGGRVKLQESMYGLTPQSSQHILLSTAMGWANAHSHDVFAAANNTAKLRTVKCFAIGNGAENEANRLTVYKPRNYETKLYKQIPFRCVPQNSDLSEAEASKYRGKILETINGYKYWCYYLKLFTVSSLQLLYLESPYTPQVSHTVPVADDDTSHPLSAGPVNVVSQFNLTVEPHEMREWYLLTHSGDITGARINELGLVMGYDAPNAYSLPTANKTELAGAELFAKLTHSPVFLDEDGSSRTVDYRIFS